jgi:hypothetical protein
MTWQRLEAATVAPDLFEGQEARIADPLWLLGRQWQVGEFKGEDAASPIFAETTLSHAPITRVRPGAPDAGGEVIERGAAGVPLETAVEREAVRTGPAAARIAAEAGLQLTRFLDTAKAPAELKEGIRKLFPLKLGPDDGLDPVGRAQLELIARRSLDPRGLHEELTVRDAKALGGLPGMKDAPVRKALDDWADWYAQLYSEPAAGAKAWNPQRMEYRFQIAAGVSDKQEVQLDAVEYTGGHLDWHAFDVAAEPKDMGARGELVEHDLRVIPTPARFAGQAASRWWRMENATVWFGDLQAAPADLARAAVASFGLTFGDDWFLAPCRLPSGVLVRSGPITVTDTFEETHQIRSCAELDGPVRKWRFFELTGDKSPLCPWLLLPPALAGRTESPPVEDVALLRDEVANLGWGAELRIESAAGRVIDRAASARANMPPPPAPAEDAWLYKLSTAVPEHQVPLVPVRTSGEDGEGRYLQRGRLELSADEEGVETRDALGRILEPDTALLIHDEEVPATGARVTRTWQMARSGDGGVVVWVGRRKSAGRPRRSSGLGFDQVLTAL